MMIVRAVNPQDLNGVFQCALKAGIGITNLPKREDVLQKKIELSQESIQKDISKPGGEEYFFVLEDLNSKNIAGTAGIHAKIGKEAPFYTFKVNSVDSNPYLKEKRLLELKKYSNWPSELCALYLLPEYRHSGIGKLLSLSRFLFLSLFPHRFEKTIFANMRGLVEDGIAPFWDGLVRHFYDVTYEEIMKQRADGESFFSDILPPFPIYVTLLPKSTQNALGKTHPHTIPAMKMLVEQGFKELGEIDPIDGGPILFVEIHNILSIKNSKIAFVTNIDSTLEQSKKYIISNGRIDFRSCYGHIEQSENNTVRINKDIAEALEISKGQTICYMEMN